MRQKRVKLKLHFCIAPWKLRFCPRPP